MQPIRRPSQRSAVSGCGGALRHVVLGLGLAAVSQSVLAYGSQGHLIAGRAAEPLLCEQAARAVEELVPGEDLGEIGLWADRIRSDSGYADSAPWHYMNIPDDVRIEDFAHPPERDVLWAIGHFSGQLGDPELGDRGRAEALKFLVHFVVDIHQPLHVGLAEDRGGNSVRILYRGEGENLHRFWDTLAVQSAGLDIADYVRALADDIGQSRDARPLDPAVWAAESQRLRPQVYEFGRRGQELPDTYVELASRITRERLGQAAVRLAATLNAVFSCD
jgi:hypothetical protein